MQRIQSFLFKSQKYSLGQSGPLFWGKTNPLSRKLGRLSQFKSSLLLDKWNLSTICFYLGFCIQQRSMTFNHSSSINLHILYVTLGWTTSLRLWVSKYTIGLFGAIKAEILCMELKLQVQVIRRAFSKKRFNLQKVKWYPWLSSKIFHTKQTTTQHQQKLLLLTRFC